MSKRKKIVVILGSPRKGNTAKAVQQLAESVDADFEILSLAKADLKMCTGCFLCLSRGERFCPLRDDRDALLEKIRRADGVVFAVPVYARQVPALFKNFIDRTAYLSHRPEFFDKHVMILVTNRAMGEKEVKRYLEKQFRLWGFRSVSFLDVRNGDPRAQEKIKRAGGRFLARVHRKRWSPRLAQIISFRGRRYFFGRDKEGMPADYAYYQPLQGKSYFISMEDRNDV